MKCETCGKTAHREGTKGRFYCFKHQAPAWEQMAIESGKRCAEGKYISEALRAQYFEERNLRAI